MEGVLAISRLLTIPTRPWKNLGGRDPDPPNSVGAFTTSCFGEPESGKLSGPLRVLEFRLAGSFRWYRVAAAMHTGETPTTTRMKSLGLYVTSTIMPNLDRILETDVNDIRLLVIEGLTVLLGKVHKKYGFAGEMPEAT